MKKIAFIIMFALVGSIFAGGDDRDKGPVESLDAIAPVVDQKMIKANEMDGMVLTDTSKKVIGRTTSGKPVTNAAHKSCKDKLDLSDYNIKIFKIALAAGDLYNTGPLNSLGTKFSPKRWAAYFSCVEQLG